MVDHRYRPKMEIQHNHSVELVGRLQRAKERVLERAVTSGGELPPMQNERTLALEAIADNHAPMMSEYEDEPEVDSSVVDAEFREI